MHHHMASELADGTDRAVAIAFVSDGTLLLICSKAATLHRLPLIDSNEQHAVQDQTGEPTTIDVSNNQTMNVPSKMTHVPNEASENTAVEAGNEITSPRKSTKQIKR